MWEGFPPFCKFACGLCLKARNSIGLLVVQFVGGGAENISKVSKQVHAIMMVTNPTELQHLPTVKERDGN